MTTNEELGQKAGEIARCIMERRLKKAGLTRSYYMQKLLALCEAQKTVSCVSGKDAGTGSVDFVDVPDNAIQLGAIKEVIMLYGDRKPIKTDSKITGDVIVNITKFGQGNIPATKK